MRLFQVREKTQRTIVAASLMSFGFQDKTEEKILQILPSLIHIVPSELHDSRDRL